MEVTSGWSLGRASWERCGASNNQRWCNEQIQWLTPFAWYFFFFVFFVFFAEIKFCQFSQWWLIHGTRSALRKEIRTLQGEQKSVLMKQAEPITDTFGVFFYFACWLFFWQTYICHGGRYMKKRVLKKRMIKRKLRRHLDSAASRGPPWKASLQGKSLTVILAPTLSGISGYHLHLILFLLSWENIIQPVKRLAINCCWIIFQQMLRNQSSRSLNNLPDLILHHM